MEDDVVVGTVSKAFGLRGDVYVHPDPDIAEAFPPGRRFRAVRLGRVDDARTLTVASSSLHSGRRIVRFEGIADRSAAEGLRGLLLTVPRNEVELDDDAFWNDDLLGSDVVDDAGALIGVLEATLDGPAHDYLVVARPDAGEVLIPAVEEFVTITPGRIVVHPIPGLLDSGEAEQVGPAQGTAPASGDEAP